MPTWVLLAALASAADTPSSEDPAVLAAEGVETSAAAPPTQVEAEAATVVDTFERPWEHYRLRSVLHPTLDTEFLTRWEPAFVRRNRFAGVGTAMGLVGTTAAFVGGSLLWTGNPIAATTFVVGFGMAIGGPIVGITQTLSASRILRAGGVRVPRGWARAAIVCLGVSALGLPVLISYPAALVLPVVQAGINRSQFEDAMGRRPGRRVTVNVVPTISREQRGLALSGTW
ncbi:MAG: hypothetical protein KC912_05600 [Proteobacteria bacterium]|nr:hypothetical protein [Pseudomonadota bacterium]